MNSNTKKSNQNNYIEKLRKPVESGRIVKIFQRIILINNENTQKTPPFYTNGSAHYHS